MMLPSYPDRVLVAGATGGVGVQVVERLRALGVSCRVLTRDSRRAARLGDVEVVQGDALVLADSIRAVEGCDAVICALGERKVPADRPIVDGDGIIHLADASVTAAAQRFLLVSSLGVGDSWQWLPFPVKWMFHAMRAVPILNEKVRSENHLKTLDLGWTILRPGYLTNRGMRSEPLVTTGRAGGTTSRQAVADVAVRCLRSPNTLGAVLTVVDRSMRITLSQGDPFYLDALWEPWRSKSDVSS